MKKKEGYSQLLDDPSEETSVEHQEIAPGRDAEVLEKERAWEPRVSDQEREKYLGEIETLRSSFDSKVADLDALVSHYFGAFSTEAKDIPQMLSLESIQERIEALNARPLSGRDYIIRAGELMMQLRKLRADIQADIDARDGAVKKRYDIDKVKIFLSSSSLEQQMENTMKIEVNELAPKEIGDSLKLFREKINTDPTFAIAIEDQYIEDVLPPLLDKAIEEGREYHRRNGHVYDDEASKRAAEQLKKEFFEALRQRLADGSPEMRESFRRKMCDFPSEVQLACEPLVRDFAQGPNSSAEAITHSLFGEYAAERISAGNGHFKREQAKADAALGGYYLPGGGSWLRYPTEASGLREFIRRPSMEYDRLPDMDLWSVGKNNPVIQRGFGETSAILDKKYRQKILDEAPFDLEGVVIDEMDHYPDPDSIEMLVLLAAAEFRGGYRTVHANGTLKRLAKRSDWQSILDAAQEKYPALKEVRPVLDDWDPSDTYARNREIKGRADDLAISLMNRESASDGQFRLAEEVLPSGKLAELLEPGEDLTAEAIGTLKHVSGMIAGDESIAGQSFQELLRNSLILTLDARRAEKKEESHYQRRNERLIGDRNAVLAISRKLLEVEGNVSAVQYLTSKGVVERINGVYEPEGGGKGIKPDEVKRFLSAYEDLPDMGSPQVASMFCEYFEGEETIKFYKRLGGAYRDKPLAANVARLVGKKLLTADRAIALAGPIKTSRGEVNFAAIGNECFQVALSHPDILLETNEGLDFLAHLNKESSLDGLDTGLEYAAGRTILAHDAGERRHFDEKILSMDVHNRMKPMFAEGKVPMLDSANWKSLMVAFIGVQEGDWTVQAPLRDREEAVNKVFESGDAKNQCLVEMKKLWLGYLEHGQLEDFPVSLGYLSRYIERAGGAGPLSQIESFGMFTSAYTAMLSKKGTVLRTKQEIATGLQSAEARFSKERWSNEEMSDFYNVSRDVISAAPSLFSSYTDLFEGLKPKEFKEFSEEIFPLHRVLLSLSEKRGWRGGVTYDARDLVRIRQYVGEVVDGSGRLRSVESQKKELTEKILEMFKSKFGIVKIPETVSPEHVRALSDYSRYLANIADRDAQKEDIVGFYLALTVNDRWDDYRQGVAIDPAEYMTPEKAERLLPYLEARAAQNPVTPEQLGIDAEKMPQFMKVLEEESENVVIGNVETVDVKLGNVIENLRSLEDFDLYPDPLDKKRMQLLLEYGNKTIGGVAAKMYQSLAGSGKQFELSADETEVRRSIEEALTAGGIALTAENVKQYFQDGIKPLAVVANISRFAEDIGAERQISELRDILRPSAEVMAVFSKMGEEFKATSGAIAISQDLEYLDNLVVKKAGELSEEERALVASYLSDIRQKLAILEDIYSLVSKKFASMRQGQAETKNDLLRSKLEDIFNIINRPDSQHMIVSAMGHSMPHIIENIRECLSCMRQGANNDTNLTFGDPNKFYISSRSEIKAGSISDEVVFFEPVTFPDETTGMAFVLDRVYGTNTPAILVNQIEAVYKKYAKLTHEFPEAKISMLVSDAAIRSSGLSGSLLIEKLKEKIGDVAAVGEVSNIMVDVVASAAGDHYIEFGGPARTAGARLVSGVALGA